MSARSSVRWYGERVSRSVRERMKGRLKRAADFAAKTTRRNVATPGPPHSLPGEYPHKVSGDLQRSIHVETDKRSLTVRIVADAPHAGIVEEKRPFLRRTLRLIRTQLRAIILGNSGSTGRYKFED